MGSGSGSDTGRLGEQHLRLQLEAQEAQQEWLVLQRIRLEQRLQWVERLERLRAVARRGPGRASPVTPGRPLRGGAATLLRTVGGASVP
jgi:hypothetical protein